MRVLPFQTNPVLEEIKVYQRIQDREQTEKTKSTEK